MSKSKKMVYVTRYALTDGIRRCDVVKEDAKYVSVAWPGAPSYGLLLRRADAHDTIESAQARAKEMAQKKLKSLAKQAAKLEKIAVAGVKVHDGGAVMTEQDRIATVEAALRAACVEARAQGLVLVRGDHIVYAPPHGRRKRPKAVGCCAWGAHDLTFRKLGTAGLSVDAPEYDAIEHGWDGERAIAERYGLPMAWFDLGARLAAEFQPVRASTLGAG